MKLRWILGVIGAGILAIFAIMGDWSGALSNRAALAVVEMGFERGRPNAEGPNLIIYKIKNTGLQTAEIKSFAIHVLPRIPPNPQYISKPPPSSIVQAGEVRAGRIGAGEMPQARVAALLTGSGKLYVYGFAEYADDTWWLGNKEFGFCYMFDPEHTNVNRFGICPDKKYTYTKHYYAGMRGNRAVTAPNSPSAPFPISRPATPDSITLTPSRQPPKPYTQ